VLASLWAEVLTIEVLNMKQELTTGP